MSRVLRSVPARVLAVFAHPDDPEVACAGALASWTAQGSDVHLIVCNRGDKGSMDPAADPDEIASEREGEVRAAAAVLGLASHEVLGYPDGEIENDVALRARLVERIRSLRPDVVIAPDPTAVFFGETYVNHRDHREVGWAVLDAVSPASSSPHYFPDAGPPHLVSTVLLSGTLDPDAWIDIADSIDTKVKAVMAHRTRVGDHPQLVPELLRERAADAGAQSGIAMAEGYRLLSFGGGPD